jgi:hypothetical protein
MNPMTRCVAIGLRLLGVTTVASGERRQPSPTKRPVANVVLILVDDIGYGGWAASQHPRLKTPNLDRLASEGAS